MPKILFSSRVPFEAGGPVYLHVLSCAMRRRTIDGLAQALFSALEALSHQRRARVICVVFRT